MRYRHLKSRRHTSTDTLPCGENVLPLWSVTRLCTKHLLHACPDVLLIDDPIAVIHRIRLMLGDRFCGLSRNPCSVHIAHCGTPCIVKKFVWQSGFYSCGAPGTVVVFDAYALSMENIGA